MIDGSTLILGIGKKKIAVISVSSPTALKKGLSGVRPIGPGKGMLFVFPECKLQSMWMIDMLFPLDIVWLDTNMQVTHITKDCPPCKSRKGCPKYSSELNSKYAIEMQAGEADSMGFEIGKQLFLTNDYYSIMS